MYQIKYLTHSSDPRTNFKPTRLNFPDFLTITFLKTTINKEKGLVNLVQIDEKKSGKSRFVVLELSVGFGEQYMSNKQLFQVRCEIISLNINSIATLKNL